MTATKEQLEYNKYLLEILGNCGMFKCTDCLYALWEDRGLGLDYKCCHPRTLPHSAWNDLDTAMRGSACDVFEPCGNAVSQLAKRVSKCSKAVSDLIDYAWRHTDNTAMGDSADEKRLRSITRAITEQGVLRI